MSCWSNWWVLGSRNPVASAVVPRIANCRAVQTERFSDSMGATEDLLARVLAGAGKPETPAPEPQGETA